jgi:hypothetical protein
MIQSDMNSYEKVRHAFESAGYKCKGDHSPRSYDGTPFSTGESPGDCAPLVDGAMSSCTHNKYARHAPLCYCEAPADTAIGRPLSDESQACPKSIFITGGKKYDWWTKNGTYLRTSIKLLAVHRGRAIYHNLDKGQYLYYWAEDGKWLIGASYSKKAPVMMSEDGERKWCPIDTSGWSQWNGAEWEQVPGLIVQKARQCPVDYPKCDRSGYCHIKQCYPNGCPNGEAAKHPLAGHVASPGSAKRRYNFLMGADNNGSLCTSDYEAVLCEDLTPRHRTCSAYATGNTFCRDSDDKEVNCCSLARQGSVRRRTWAGDAKDNCWQSCGLCEANPCQDCIHNGQWGCVYNNSHKACTTRGGRDFCKNGSGAYPVSTCEEVPTDPVREFDSPVSPTNAFDFARQVCNPWALIAVSSSIGAFFAVRAFRRNHATLYTMLPFSSNSEGDVSLGPAVGREVSGSILYRRFLV